MKIHFIQISFNFSFSLGATVLKAALIIQTAARLTSKAEATSGVLTGCETSKRCAQNKPLLVFHVVTYGSIKQECQFGPSLVPVSRRNTYRLGNEFRQYLSTFNQVDVRPVAPVLPRYFITHLCLIFFITGVIFLLPGQSFHTCFPPFDSLFQLHIAATETGTSLFLCSLHNPSWQLDHRVFRSEFQQICLNKLPLELFFAKQSVPQPISLLHGLRVAQGTVISDKKSFITGLQVVFQDELFIYYSIINGQN